MNEKINTRLWNLNDWSQHCWSEECNSGWSQFDVEPNVPVKIALIHSELSEALEGDRKGLMDDHLPERKAFEVELADTLIRIFALAGGHKLDLEGAVREKMEYNQNRNDHKKEVRAAEGGKKY